MSVTSVQIRAGNPSWTPANINSVPKYWWLRADLGVTLGTGVTTWADQFGLNNATQGTGSAQPTLTTEDSNFNGQSSITFDGTDDALVFTNWDPPAPPLWFWFVFRQLSFGSGDTIFGSASTILNFRQQTGAGTVGMLNPTSANANSAAPINTTLRGIVSYTSSTSDRIQIASTNVTGTNSGSSDGGLGTFSLGSRTSGTAGFFHGVFAEIACFGGEPTSAELSLFESYGRTRYSSGPF